MQTPAVQKVAIFTPTKDLQTSIQFYKAIGWQLNWETEGLAEIEFSGTRLYLQNYYAKEWAENFMIYIQVDDAQAWYAHLKPIIENYPSARIATPKQEPYGALVTYLWDPVGILIHYAEMC